MELICPQGYQSRGQLHMQEGIDAVATTQRRKSTSGIRFLAQAADAMHRGVQLHHDAELAIVSMHLSVGVSILIWLASYFTQKVEPPYSWIKSTEMLCLGKGVEKVFAQELRLYLRILCFLLKY